MEDFEKAIQELNLPQRGENFRQKLYAALCNTGWKKDNQAFTCSWRAAGSLVAEYSREGENYLDYYCSGGEGKVDAEIREALAPLEWEPCEWEEAAAINFPEKRAKYLGQLAFKDWFHKRNPKSSYSQLSSPSPPYITFDLFQTGEKWTLDVNDGSVYEWDGEERGKQILPPVK